MQHHLAFSSDHLVRGIALIVYSWAVQPVDWGDALGRG
jgi:hypothetical protein